MPETHSQRYPSKATSEDTPASEPGFVERRLQAYLQRRR